ncbi:C40 family peptidase [Tahibacter soli]|uniref:C40 family peptidase n=1 Tax=Tahibacter soli TaxID=2983605 RepID=A0A9X3YGK2_9GAMM|nr:C40 family peptidase [Tahibacter soli]MDC8011844.1 C40 family peptidase [Tahibacter soli]
MTTILRWCALALAASLLAACGRKAVKFEGYTPAQEATANEVLFRAISLVGTPYRYGGNTPQTGFDCSGLIGYIFADVAGVKLPRSAEAISELKAPKISRGKLMPGDLVFFRDGGSVSHVGIYIGEGRFVHAPNSGGTVRLDALDGDYWRQHYDGAKRLFR